MRFEPRLVVVKEDAPQLDLKDLTRTPMNEIMEHVVQRVRNVKVFPGSAYSRMHHRHARG